MTGQEKIVRGYTVRVRQAADRYQVTYTPRDQPAGHGNGSGQTGLTFEVVIRADGADVRLLSANVLPELDANQTDFEADALRRGRLLHEWLCRLSSRAGLIEAWAKELGWSTRIVEKNLEDSQIGRYQAPALLMQEGVDRILLEPVGRTAPGADGVVDLYLLPGYDDIASFYFYEGVWNLHYAIAGSALRETPARPLSKESFQGVLAEMRQHAA
jgi:hypothetical protein